MSTPTPNPVKCVVVGSWKTGRDSLLITYGSREFPESVPFFFDDTIKRGIRVDGQSYLLCVDKANTQEMYTSIRKRFTYANTNVFVLCFSVVLPSTFLDVESWWHHEVRNECPDVPILLVGTQTDLRLDEETLENLRKLRTAPVQSYQGTALAEEIGAIGYVECSAKYLEEVDAVFEQACRAAVQCGSRNHKVLVSTSNSKRNKDCVIV
ncbi:P-loop containing nucleoside triphosphate hydrolase protein [Flagelloscypha sp. PMI_526]|nr:P-loop containing nucleoside triphosphate hydrolase protein [Flagelloscypha sp. PMI_526]